MRAALAISCLAIVVAGPARPLHAGELRGAEEALRQLARPAGRPAPAETPISRFRCEPAERIARQQLVSQISEICDRDRVTNHPN